jgi:drug/metabolite transporter (DMT)-like permease
MTMTFLQYAFLVLYTVGTAVGQLLFKIASNEAMSQDGFRPRFLFSNFSFYVAITLYGLLTIMWVWLLSQMPLSRAYPFLALSFIFTPLFAIAAFHEKLSINYVIGLALIICGLVLTQR